MALKEAHVVKLTAKEVLAACFSHIISLIESYGCACREGTYQGQNAVEWLDHITFSFQQYEKAVRKSLEGKEAEHERD